MWFLYFLECIERFFWALAWCDISKPMRTTGVGTTTKDILIGSFGVVLIIAIIVGAIFLIRYLIKNKRKKNKN